MNMNLRSLLLSAPSLLLFATPALAQPAGAKSAILHDAVVTRGSELKGTADVDIYVSVPYQSMEFQELDQRYAAQYKLHIVIRDLLGRRMADTTLTRSMLTDSYVLARGSGGQSDNNVSRFELKPSTYRYEITVNDAFSHREYSISDSIVVRDLSLTPSMSTPLYLSQIEQRGDRYAITPYIGYLMWNPEASLFAFFQVYVDELPQRVAFSWTIEAKDGRYLGRGLGAPTTIDSRTSQHFLPLRLQEKGLPADYTLKVEMHPVEGVDVDTTITLASSTKPYIIPRSLAGVVLSDMDLAIKQLAYVADQDQIDLMLAAPDAAERQFRFEEFWKGLDPTPQTVRNEAFEEYYQRVATANKRFKSYADGWLTDMGRVFIIFGEPGTTDQYQGTSLHSGRYE